MTLLQEAAMHALLGGGALWLLFICMAGLAGQPVPGHITGLPSSPGSLRQLTQVSLRRDFLMKADSDAGCLQ